MPDQLTAPLIDEEYEGAFACASESSPDASPALGTAMFVIFSDEAWNESEVLDDSMCWSGFCVTSAASANEAVRILDLLAGRVSIALVNAERSGPGASRLLQVLHSRHPGVLPVAVVGWENREQVRAAYAGGAEIVMRRPFTLDDLTSALLAMRNQAEERIKTERAKARTAAASLPQRILGALRAVRRRSAYPRTRSFLRTAAFLAAACLVSVGVLSALESAKGTFGGQVERLSAFMDRVEGYLSRDEAREIRVFVPRAAPGGDEVRTDHSAPRKDAR